MSETKSKSVGRPKGKKQTNIIEIKDLKVRIYYFKN